MRARLGAVLVLVVGCRAELPAPPPGAQIVCTSDADCPTGLVCRVSVGQCRQASADQTPPRLVSSSASPALGNGAVPFIAVLEVDEALARPPVVWAEVRGERLAFTLDESGTSPPSYRFHSVTLTPGLEGAAQVFADLVDLEGNPSFAQLVGSFAIDTTPPAVLRASPSAPAYKSGDVVTYQVNVSEALARPPSLLVRQGSTVVPTVLTTLINQSVASFTFATPVSAFTDGDYSVTLSLEDLAGNTSTNVSGAGFGVDRTPPVLTLPSVTPLLAREGLEVVATFTVAEPLAVPPVVSLGSAPMQLDPAVTPPQYRATATVATADGEGPRPVVARIIDVAGNLVLRQLDIVTFDFTAPDLVTAATQVLIRPGPRGALTAPTALGPASSLQVLITMTEPGTASLVSAPLPLAFSATAFGPSFIFTSTLAADAGVDGQAQRLTATLTDAAGNARVVTLGPGVVLDSVAPAAPLVDDDTHVTYRRVPWGSADAGAFFELTGEAGSVEPSSTVLAVDQGGLEIGRGPASDAGSFSLRLAPADRSVVLLRALDGAGNEGVLRDVKNVEWVASLRGKVAGSSNVNPHFSDLRPEFARSFDWPNRATETALPILAEGTPRYLRRTFETNPAQVTTGPSAWDSERNRLVLLRNDSGPLEVWELDLEGGTWTNRTPSPLPASWPPLKQSGSVSTATFDSARGQVVYCAQQQGASRAQIWELDVVTTTWTLRTVTPMALAQAAAYDEARGRVVFLLSSIPLSSAEWDPVTNTWSAPLFISPAPSGSMVMTYLRSRGVIAAIDQTSASTTHEYNGATGTWTARTTALRPGPMTSRAFFPGASGKAVLVGMANNGPNPGLSIWEWDSTAGTWLERSASPRPVPWPDPQGNLVRAGFDAASGRLLVSFALQAWEWTSATGTWVARSNATLPEPRYGHSAVFDTTRGTMWTFGGVTDAGATLDELWEFAPGPGTWVNRTASVASWPPARQAAAMVFDEARNRSVLTLGTGVDGGLLSDVWEWDGVAWTERFPAPRPPGRNNAAFFSVADAGRPMLFGGALPLTSPRNDLWEWNGAGPSWTGPRLVAEGATAKESVSTGDGFVVINSALSTLTRGPLPCPPTGTCGTSSPMLGGPLSSRFFMAGVFDLARRRTVTLFSGPINGELSSVFELDEANQWHAPTPQPLPRVWPSARQDYSRIYDARRGQVVVFGGILGSLALPSGPATAEVWEWGLSPAMRPSATFRFAFSFAQAEPTSVLQRIEARVTGGASGNGSDGLRLCPLDVGAFTCLASNAAPTAAPAEVLWSSTNPLRYVVGSRQDVTFALTPTGANSPFSPATFSVTDAQVLVRYHRP